MSRNCSLCTRWRPITDFTARKRDKGGKVTKLHSRCRPCENLIQRERYHRYARNRKIRLAAGREHQAVKRREAEVSVRKVGPNNKGKYGAGRIVPIDQTETKRKWRARQDDEFFERERLRKKADRKRKQ